MARELEFVICPGPGPMVLPPALLPPRPEAPSPKEGQGLQKSEMKGDEERVSVRKSWT